jgi:chromosomal replication initiator protein
MEERLLTRFKWGLMAELEKPSQELCRKILVSKMRRDGLDIPDDVIDYITQNVDGSVRDLEGIVNALMAHAVVYNTEINLEVAQQIVRRTVKRQAHTMTIEDIIDACCTLWQVTQDDVFSQSRKANIVLVRQTIMYLAQRHTKLSTSKIGLLVGGRNHATVLHAIAQVKNRLATTPVYAQQVAEVENQLRSRK